MFSVDDNGAIVYNEDIVDNGSLFGDVSDYATLVSETTELSPETESDITVIENAATNQISGGDAAVVSQDITVYNVYAVPSSSTGYPNANSLSYLEDVVQGYPLDYGYVAYRTDNSYAQSMILFIGPEYEYDGGSVVNIYDCDVVELTYTFSGSGYSSYINRSYDHEDVAEITLTEGALIYTNTAPGYAAFETTMEESAGNSMFTYILIGVAAFFILGRLLGGKNHD